MDSTEKTTGRHVERAAVEEHESESIILESAVFAVILLFLFVGNFITLLIMVLNCRTHRIPNIFVASFTISDFCLGAFSACPLSGPVPVTSQWLFSDVTC